jgi:hypothetical protein
MRALYQRLRYTAIEATAAAAGETGTNWMINRVVEIDPKTEECSTHLLPRPDP